MTFQTQNVERFNVRLIRNYVGWVEPISEFGIRNSEFPPTRDRTADTATAAEGSDSASLQRLRSVITVDAESIVPVDQSPGHRADVIEGLECFVSPRPIDGTGMAEKT